MICEANSKMCIILDYIRQYIFGSDILAGFWILLVFFGFMSALRIEFTIGIVLIIPLCIVFMAYGFVPLLAGGILILASSLVVASRFFIK